MNTGTFSRHRKIMPFEPGAAGNADVLRAQSRQKAAALNSHVLGYGEVAEREWAAAGIAAPNLPAMRKYRLERIRAELKRRDCAGALLYDPVNIRYATDSTNMQLWVAHNPAIASSRPKGLSFCSTISPASIFPTIPVSSTTSGRPCRGHISTAVNCRAGALRAGLQASPIWSASMAAATDASPSITSIRRVSAHSRASV